MTFRVLKDQDLMSVGGGVVYPSSGYGIINIPKENSFSRAKEITSHRIDQTPYKE
jgi:hypothetical protein